VFRSRFESEGNAASREFEIFGFAISGSLVFEISDLRSGIAAFASLSSTDFGLWTLAFGLWLAPPP